MTHKLLHTAASMADAASVDRLLIASMLDHDDVREIFTTYTHLLPNRLDEVTRAVEQAWHNPLAVERS